MKLFKKILLLIKKFLERSRLKKLEYLQSIENTLNERDKEIALKQILTEKNEIFTFICYKVNSIDLKLTAVVSTSINNPLVVSKLLYIEFPTDGIEEFKDSKFIRKAFENFKKQ